MSMSMMLPDRHAHTQGCGHKHGLTQHSSLKLYAHVLCLMAFILFQYYIK